MVRLCFSIVKTIDDVTRVHCQPFELQKSRAMASRAAHADHNCRGEALTLDWLLEGVSDCCFIW